MKILVTTTSFLDTPGAHVNELNAINAEIIKARGPLNENQLIDLINLHSHIDGCIVGEDEITATVLNKLAPHTKVISKYGVGLDRIDVEHATSLGIQVTNTPGVNHTTVSELTFAFLLSLARYLPEQNNFVHNCSWRRMTGVELAGKTLGVLGFGRVGREVSKRALAFGMNLIVYNTSWSQELQNYFVELNRVFSDPIFQEFPPKISKTNSLEEVLSQSHFLTLHMNLNKNNVSFLNAKRLSLCRKGVLIVNVSRSGLVDQKAIADSIRSGHVAGFGSDVLEPEPVTPDNPLLNLPRVHLTPHIGSRTIDSVIRQGLAAVTNLKRVLNIID
jgi:D-3-phosphoglycerate dehydrogenase / 2-oxoglutarate reductase